MTLVERAQTQAFDGVGLEAAVRDQAERLCEAVVAEAAAEMDSSDVAHNLQGALGGLHEVVAAPGRHDDGVQHLELAAALLGRALGGLGRLGGGRGLRSPCAGSPAPR